ncbi:MAG: Hsp20/alpha crystallin family protein [Chitinophagaceae bacterium]|nr:MAG: Hsp20/alpha crystallin family protein [Chitinophagaceae bacterium]
MKPSKLKISIMTQNHFRTRPVASNASFNNLLDDFFAPFSSVYSERPATASRTVVPVNVRESESGLSLDVVAPGFAKEDFTIKLEDKVLTVSAEQKREESAKTEKFLRHEYKFASFKRSFTLDESIDGAGVSAQYVNGVLTLNLPKRAEVKASVKQIEIQ